MNGKVKNKSWTIINAHTHINSVKHVPLILLLLVIALWPVKWILFNLPIKFKFLERIIQFLEIGLKTTQAHVFEILRSHYPNDTKFVLLAMDMRYMGGGPPAQNYDTQLKNLAKIKDELPNAAYPFFCVDPRRDDVYDKMREYIEVYNFQGIKIYPSFGYFPFPFNYMQGDQGARSSNQHLSKSNEKALEEVFTYAQKHQIPVLTHTTPGGLIGYRQPYRRHPVTNKFIWPTRKQQVYHLAHPRNYVYLLEQFPDLKICLAHFGGHGDWRRHLSDPLETYESDSISQEGKDEIMVAIQNNRFIEPVWNPRKGKVVENTWNNVIRYLLKDADYKNVYTDISYNAFDFETLSYLKILVENSSIKNRILFGTDFPVVRRHRSEKEFSIGMRAFLGEVNFRLIAEKNPINFLNNQKNPFP